MKILVFQHLDVEHPGSLRGLWASDGIEWDAVELDTGDAIPQNLSDYDMLVVMGGPQDVWEEDKYPWLAQEKRVIAEFVLNLGRPYLGICLGHQLLAAAIGGSVGKMDAPEVGLVPVDITADGKADPFFKDIESPLMTLQWHGAEVKSLPSGSVVLAANEHCGIQSFRYGKYAYGLQFHVEVTADTVPDWRAVPEYKAAMNQALGEDGADRFAAEARDLVPTFEAKAALLHRNFMAVLEAEYPAFSGKAAV